MHWEFIAVLIIAIPIILIPVAFLWYLNAGGIYRAIQETRKRRSTQEQERETAAIAGKNTGHQQRWERLENK